MKPLELKCERVRNGISTELAAKAIHKSPEAYKKKESGETRITLDEVVTLSKLYKLSGQRINEIFFDSQLPIGNNINLDITL